MQERGSVNRRDRFIEQKTKITKVFHTPEIQENESI